MNTESVFRKLGTILICLGRLVSSNVINPAMDTIGLTINRLAQSLLEIDKGIKWFEKHSVAEKRKILHSLHYFIIQSHPRPDEVNNGMINSGLKDTFTPCVLIKKRPLKEALSQIEKLTEHELCKAFKLGIHIFIESDTRRRKTDCIDGCSHEWHNLSSL